VLHSKSVRVCAVTAAILTSAISPASSLTACEKSIAHGFWLDLIKRGLVEGTIAAGGYKAYKLSNSLEQKDVAKFLREHGMTNRRAIQKISRYSTRVVRSKPVRYGSLATMVIGGASVLAEFIPREYPPGRGPDTRIVAPTKSLGGEERINDIASKLETSLKEEFGEKLPLALELASYSIMGVEDSDGSIFFFSTLEECAEGSKRDFANDSGKASPKSASQAVVILGATTPTFSAAMLARCNGELIACNLSNDRVINIMKEILSPVVHEKEIIHIPEEFTIPPQRR